MKRTLLRIAAAVLVCLQIALLAACGGDNTPGEVTTTSDAAETTPAETSGASGISLVEDGKAKYKVIRPESASKTLISLASGLRKTLSDAAGVNIGISDDWIKSTDQIDPDAFEILIGATNREASKITADLKPDDYTICVSGNAIVITGGSDKAIAAAIDTFVAECLNGATVMLDKPISKIIELACPDFAIAGTPISGFVPVYSASAEAEEAVTIANSLIAVLGEKTGVVLKAVSDTAKSDVEKKIFIGPTSNEYSKTLYAAGFDTFDYRIEVKDGNLYLAGGSCFALQYCVNLLRDEYLSNGRSLDAGLTLTGSAYGKTLYDVEEGADVRIMSNNVWQCDTNQPAWKKIGEDCSAEVRSKGLAAVYMAYQPDVICFQEMSVAMIRLIRKELTDCGYKYKLLSFSSGGDADYTCILYREDTLELVERGYHEFTYGCNGGTKSYTWGYFKHKATEKTFVALSTHLWWKSESAQAGSEKMRERQAAEIVAAMDKLIAKHNAPVYIMGDFNTRTTSTVYKVFTDGGFKDTFDLASVFAHDHKGRHSCNSDGFSREPSGETYKSQAIDHIMLKNGGNTDILVFNHARPYFYIKLSDHYPVFVDTVLG